MGLRVWVFMAVSAVAVVLNKVLSWGLGLIQMAVLLALLFLALILPSSFFPAKPKGKELQKYYSSFDFDSIPSRESLNQPESDPAPAPAPVPEPAAAPSTQAAPEDGSSSALTGAEDPNPQPTFEPPKPSPADDANMEKLLRTLGEAGKGEWKPLLETPTCKVYRSEQGKYRFRLEVLLHNTAMFCFKVMTDEKNWALKNVKVGNFPSLIHEAREVEEVDAFTKIIYVHVKGIWPVGDRDVLLRFHKRTLEDGRLAVVATSTQHPSVPPRTAQKITRVICDVSGAVFSPAPNDPDKCYVVQVSDGDPQGWIPETLINLACTQVIPQALWVINKLIEAPKARRPRRKAEEGPSDHAAASRLEASPGAEAPESHAKQLPTAPAHRAEAATGSGIPSSSRKSVPAPTAPSQSREAEAPASQEVAAPVHLGLLKLVLPQLERFRRGLRWATPFILAVLYFMVFFRLAKRVGRR